MVVTLVRLWLKAALDKVHFPSGNLGQLPRTALRGAENGALGETAAAKHWAVRQAAYQLSMRLAAMVARCLAGLPNRYRPPCARFR
jgi:hypothetical protein